MGTADKKNNERLPYRGFDSVAVRHGQVRTAEGEHNDPVFFTSSFVFDNARQAADRFTDKEAGNVYSRFTNPTVRVFERRLAAMEGGVDGAASAIGTASGMSAILCTVLAFAKAGDHIVAARNLFGSTVSLFTRVLSRFGIDTTYVALGDVDAWRAAARKNTRLFFLETPSNPLGEIGDIAALAALAGECGALLVVDNCLCTPALQRPLTLGADVVVHTATKFIDGQGRCVGGAVVVDDAERYAALFNILRTAGPCMSPLSAWVFLNGLETLSLRMRAHSAAALAVAKWLESHPAVRAVHYPGLASHPQHELAARQQKDFGGVLSFEVHGGRAEAWKVIDATRMLSITGNLGDAKTTITHPATTTHGRLSDAERKEMGVGENLLRVCAGLEDVDDICADLARGLG